ncbi:flagellar hook capping FlgD N-terminal domain-containing protein [Ostreiculturibacter nitratireducens]|uniref:flagellar hook capping FlgD N-terminal domain-containing protein n=1 Tax=Ostreiculturibacter nitratireducens TaxID=3075226 RepID=UPI0031B598CD
MTMDVAAVSATTASAASTGATGKGALIESDFQTFLVMLTTQMQNQDPLNPIESSDYAVQLATFSGVEQQVKSNDLLENLVSQMGLMGMAQMAGWVGMEARAAAPAWFDGGPVTLAPNPAAAADEAVLVVHDETGAEVSRRPVTVSSDPVTWNGLTESGTVLPNGLYGFRLESYLNGAIIANDRVEVYSPIVEARGENGGTVLVLEGGARISANDVTALRKPRSG